MARWAAHAAAIALIVVVVGVAAFAIRLSRGPIDVAWAVRAALARSGAQHVQVAEATLRWTGFHDGAGSPIRLAVRGLRVTAPDGSPRLTADEGEASVSMTGLLSGEVLPRAVELRGARLTASRDAAGRFQLDLGDDGGPNARADNARADNARADDARADDARTNDARAELRRPPATDRDAAGGHALRQLRRLSLHDASVDVADARLGPWRLANVDVELVRGQAGGLEGQAELDATLGGLTTHLSVHAALATGGGSRIELSSGPVNPAALARLSPALAQAALFDAAITPAAAIVLDPAGAPVSATLRAAAGPGQAQLPQAVVRFDSLAAQLQIVWVDGAPTQLRDLRLDAVLPSPSGGEPTAIGITADGERADGQVRGHVVIDLDRLAFADLDRMWPKGVGTHAREWITANISAGTGRDAHMDLMLSAPADLSDAQLTRAGGRMRGEDVSVFWLKPIPPVEHLNCQLTLVDPDVLDIAVDPAAGAPRQGRIAIPGGLVHVTGLAGAHQVAQINVDLAGSMADTLALLRHPRLKLLSKHPVPIQSAVGSVSGKLGVRVPLENNVDFDTISITANMRLADLRLAGIVAGRDLTRGTIRLDATNDGLKAAGTATVAGLPGRLGVEMDFRGGGPDQVVQSATFDTQADAARLAGAGLAAAGVQLTGAPQVNVAYVARRSGSAEVQARADLTAAGIVMLGWRKAPGQPAHARAHVLLDHDRLAGIDVLHADGPGLSIDGRSEVVGGKPVALVIDQGQFGLTRASGEIRFGSPLRVSLNGAMLDASPFLKGGGASESGGAYVIDARFAEVLLGPGRRLAGVVAHVDSEGGRLRQATLEAAGPVRLTASLTPSAAGRTVRVRASDGGALLRLLDVTDTVQGGALSVDAQYQDRLPGRPLVGTVELGEFQIHQAAVIGKVLQGMTLYGLIDALRGPGLLFEKLVMPFRYANETLDVSNARAFSSSLGVTVQGLVDLGRNAVELRGTIVPAYALNTALGRLPLIGRVFSPEQSGGVFAANYSVKGRLSDPDVSVNPLSALAPGILRKLFDVFD